jgi:hypothetical protein
MYNKGNKGTTAGILSIVAGAIGVLNGIAFGVFSTLGFLFFSNPAFVPYPPPTQFTQPFLTILAVIYSVIGFGTLLVGILGIIGGIFSLKRKNWGVALAGAIAGSVTFWPCGIVAVVFVSLGKSEFEIIQPAAVSPAAL